MVWSFVNKDSSFLPYNTYTYISAIYKEVTTFTFVSMQIETYLQLG